MKRELLNKTVAEELQHIERGTKGSDQNAFRMIYNMIRRRDLGRDPMTHRVRSFRRAVDAIREHSPSFAPRYNRSYFELR